MASPYAIGETQSRALWHFDSLQQWLATSEDTDDRFWVTHTRAARGASVPWHLHEREDEAWYVLEGDYTFFVGDQELRATAGSFVFLPRGVPHTLRVDSMRGRCLNLGVPGGFDRFFFETGRPAPRFSLPGADAEPPPDAATLAGVCHRYGVTIVGAPPT
ncbi:MAG: quercetin 2,3-dioxygenase [Acidimicrobiales bacterium]